MALNREGADTAIKVTLGERARAGAGGQADDQVVGQKGLTSSLHPDRSTPRRLIPATAEQQTSADLI